MPELPEVETIVRIVRPRLEGREIRRVRASWSRTLGDLSVAEFGRRVVGARITRVWRRGKYFVFDLERDGNLCGWIVGHLRMSGRIHVEADDWKPGPHGRVRLNLDDSSSFHFIDVRKFGRLRFVTDLSAVTSKLGPEPLTEEFSPEWLRTALRRHRRFLKPLLLDQAFLAGLGNIYVDESLNLARLHPLRRSDRLRADAVRRLHAAIRETLEEAIAREGSSFDTFYRTPEGNPGSYQHQFRVYGRTGQPCPNCGRNIAKITVGQRGTHYCPGCQRVVRNQV